ncbi:MAG: right-handed parallel beta-helix repeat-containing protein [Lewinellaceae bacterium]|nr:right-handed parallel beta-helix repeat-containing protein [Lewinellaceae bacterium]
MKKVTNHFHTFLLTCCLLLAIGQTAQANLRYVKPNASGAGDGSSWADASDDLQAMIDDVGVTEIWVAAGTYRPTSTTDRTISFVMKNGVAIYGGFAGGETSRGARDWTANLTILSGDLLQDDGQQPIATNAPTNTNTGDNAFTVVNGSNTDATAILDGFIITAGHSNGNGPYPDPNARGGGMFINNGAPTITNCTFSGNAAPNAGGGGIYSTNSTGFVVSGCTFTGNYGYGGGGIYNSTSSVMQLTDCSFAENSATFGGAIYTHSTSTQLTLENCSISNNSSLENGGGINSNSQLTLENCSISNNTTLYSGGGIASNGPMTIVNCSISNNTATLYGGGISSGKQLTIDTCEIFENQADRGGGVYHYYHEMVMNNTSVRANEALGGGSGGGIYLIECYLATMTNCVVSENIVVNTNGYGVGGILSYNGAQNTNLTLVNCTVANHNGMGIRGSGGTFYLTTTLTNTIVADNETNFYYSPYSNGSTVSGGNNLDDDGTSGFTNGVNGDITLVDPLFVSSTDLRLQPGSPAIDAGKAAGAPTTDRDGKPRPIGPAFDMGAYEFGTPCPTGNILYVNENATGANIGASWANAFTNLQDALNSTCPNVTEIWVAAGTYKPTSGTDRSISFVMKDNLAIYGGFAGVETSLSERNPVANVTTLSGDIGVAGNNTDNSYHVINNEDNGLTNAAVLDGFVVTGGYGGNGGGMQNISVSPTVANCIFLDNTATANGGGMFNSQTSSPIVLNCTFSGGSAVYGGGMFNSFSSPVLTNCAFSGNSAFYGGGLSNSASSSPVLTNCAFLGNNAFQFGGGLYNYSNSSPTVTNCSFSGNSATTDGSIYVESQVIPLIITNCIFWGNNPELTETPACYVTYSIVEGGYTGTGNLDLDPLFVGQPPVGLGTTGDLQLQAASPAIDAGTSGTNIPDEDITGKPRPLGNGYDMGAYEYGIPCSGGNILYVNKSASGKNYGTSWNDAFINLQDALNTACPDITEIWVAAGTYYPDEGNGYTDNDRSHAFVMIDNVAIYGGFAGGETSLSERDLVANPTILSGDIDQVTGNVNNSYHVIFNNNNGLDSAAILDGFTITGGNANGNFNPAVYGGGMLNNNSSPTVANCSFSGNSATTDGGGMFNSYCSPTVINCSFSGNTTLFGGGMNNLSSSPTVTNCSFSGNTATYSGGGMINQVSSFPKVTNCSFSGNTAPNGGGMSNRTSSITVVTNCILWGNSSEIFNDANSDASVTYSIVQGGYTGTGNLDIDPFFVNAASNNLHLQPCSPAKNVGATQAQAPAGVTIPTSDFDGDARPIHGGFDMGFDENGILCCPPADVLFVNANATGYDNGTSWSNAYTDLQDALNSPCPGITQIWVAAGTYKPTSCTTCSASDRAVSFVMSEGVSILGGFPNTGNPGINDVDPVLNVTILSGDIGMVGDTSDNSFHIIFNNNNVLTSNTVLSGFTITGGNASGSWPHNTGGGMYNNSSSPTLTNCTFLQNNATFVGGAMYDVSSNIGLTDCQFTNNFAAFGGAIFTHAEAGQTANHTLSGCIFTGNNAEGGGGAIVHGFPNSAGTGLFDCTNCTFVNNIAFNGDTFGGGGAFFNEAIGFDGKFTNCLFDGNQGLGTADWGGGALLVYEGNCTVLNSTFVNNNSAAEGGAISVYSSNSTLDVKNSIFWDNTAVTENSISNSQGGLVNASYCMLQDNACPANVTCGQGMMYAQDPLFVSSTDFHIQNNSPATDAGVLFGAPAADFEGDTRPFGAGVDLGIDENMVLNCPLGNVLYVNANATGANNGTSWENAYTELQGALNNPCPGITEIWVAAGTYKPTSGTDRTISFVMKNGLAFLGGFPNTGNPGIGDRNWTANVTILSGDIDGDNTLANNSYHVISNNGNGLNNTAILDGFTITGGNADGTGIDIHGGGMYNAGSSPTVNNCSFSGNSGVTGGGISNSNGSSPTVSNCSFSGNSVTTNGGGMSNSYSAPTLTNCSFSGNSAANIGGGMYNLHSSPTIDTCSFSQDTAAFVGGAMYSAQSNVSMTGCQFTNNFAENGGAIYTHAVVGYTANHTLSGCSFTGNNATNAGGAIGSGFPNYFGTALFDCTNCIFSNNVSNNGSGGAFYTNRAGFNGKFTNCLFDSNQAQGAAVGDGGALGLHGGNCTVVNSTFVNNTSETEGGAISVYSSSSTLEVKNSIFWDNTAVTENSISNSQGGVANAYYCLLQDNACPANVTCGEGMIYAQDPLFVSSTDFHIQNNSPATDAGTLFGAPATDFEGDGRPFGAGIDMGYDENMVFNCPGGNVSYVNASATGANNGSSWVDAYTNLQDALNLTCPGITEIWVAAGTYKPTSGTDRGASFVMRNNVAILGGFPNTGNPGIGDRNWTANVTILSGDIDGDNTLANNSYHVISNYENGLDNSAILDGFTITGGNADGTGIDIYGGGMHNAGSSPTVINCSFSGNSATNSGGGMYNTSSSPTVTNCSFSGNSATNSGGGMYNIGSSPSVTNCSFSGNSGVAGGGINNSNSSSPTVSNCSFSGNSATTNGGGMSNSYSAPTLTNCSFSGNSSANIGGGMYNLHSSPTIDTCTFSQDTAAFVGGAMYSAAQSNVSMTGCQFTNNFAENGGAIYTNAVFFGQTANHTLSGCSFTGNNATNAGGAIGSGFLNSAGSALFDCTNCNFSNNVSNNGSGGAFYTEKAGFNGKFTNCLFDSNQAQGAAVGDGGALGLHGGNCTVVNSTFVNNTSETEGGAISVYSGSSTLEVKNSIFWDNTAVTENSISNSQGGVANASYCLLQDNACPANVNCGQGMIYAQDPLFVSSTDFHIQNNSPATDAGTLSGAPATDFEGDGRPFGAGLDLGFDENMANNCPAGNVSYVNESATGANNGTSWVDAYTDLQDALSKNCPNITEIWVAAGTYKPTSGTDRGASFVMRNNVAIYGGFAGGETMLSQRDWTTNVTTLSGEIGAAGIADNSYHVIFNDNNGLTNSAILDGFTISGGNANGNTYPFDNGGGMINLSASPTLANCIFTDNTAIVTGGGMFNRYGSPSLINCSFSNNTANVRGGGIFNLNLSLITLTNCNFFSNNSANGGAGMASEETNAIIIDSCNFTQNTGAGSGGVLRFLQVSVDANVEITACNFIDNQTNSTVGALLFVAANSTALTASLHDCQFSGNEAEAGGALGAFGTVALDITNCDFTNNSAEYAGALYAGPNNGQVGNLTLLDCQFIGNTGRTSVGGVLTWGFTCNATNCIFKNNEAGIVGASLGTGGAWQIQGPNTQATLTNCLLEGNKAFGTIDDGGGAIMVYGGNVTLQNTTVANNESVTQGGAVSIFDNTGTVTINNSILWNNTAVTDNSIYNGNGGAASATYSLIQDNTCPANVTCGEGMIYAQDPLFVSSTDFHIQDNSPATDAGTPIGVPASDFEGDARPFGYGVDLGYDENMVFNCPGGNVFYINASATGANNGTSWVDAYTNLQDALNNTCPGITEIWVAAGTYKPSSCTTCTDSDRSVSFSMTEGVHMIGGFPNTGNPGINDVDPVLHVTTLSGDIGVPGDDTDNSFHIIFNDNNGLTNSAILDGFTISGGHSNDNGGGGMLNDHASPTVVNCNFTGNSSTNGGGGILNSFSSPVLTNCIFTGNSSTNGGGGILNSFSSPLLTNCIFTGNSSTYGGGMANKDSSLPVLINCAFSGNTATQKGGGINNYFSSSSTLTNCTFSGNTANTSGGSVFVTSAILPSPVTNCIFWGNNSELLDNGSAVVDYSIVEGGFTGTGNLDEDPLFTSPTDLRPLPCSPALDMGSNAANTSTIDLDGSPRKVNATGIGTTTIDMGAFELQSNITLPSTWTGLGDGTLWSDPANWSDGFVPQPCRDVVIPAGTVTIPAAFNAKGKTLDVVTGALLEVAPTARMDIKN